MNLKSDISKVLFAAMLLAGCDGGSGSDDPNNGGDKATLKVNPVSLSFSASGETKQVSVTAENVVWKAETDAEWLTIVDGEGSGNGVFEIKAASNELSIPLNAAVIVSGEGVDAVSIEVTQEAASSSGVETKAIKYVECSYAGDYWGTGGQLDNVYIVMTDMEISNNSLVPPGSVLMIDMNIPASSYADFDIVGTYTAGSSELPTKYTFNADEILPGEGTISYLESYDASGVSSRIDIKGGAMKITKNGSIYHLACEFLLGGDAHYKGVFDGEISFYNDTTNGNSTLKENASPVFESASAAFYDYGQSSITSYLCVLSLTGDKTASTYDNMSLQLHVDPAVVESHAIEGTYTVIEKDISEIYTNELVPGTILPGYLSKSDSGVSFGGSWYLISAVVDGQAQLGGMAPLMKGQCVISRDGETYTVAYTFVDDNTVSPHTISGTYTGAVDFGGGGDNPDNPDNPQKPAIAVPTGATLNQFKPGGRW